MKADDRRELQQLRIDDQFDTDRGEFIAASLLLRGIIEYAMCGAFVPDEKGRPMPRATLRTRGRCVNCGKLDAPDLAERCPLRVRRSLNT